ncbi:MAG: hypothetical protein EXX96DRAFT_576207 [Benjaminiella poitrasii]|nr:MAG: hypothetical protein EXX96DRAFT_576207 [Benjaminiella poitrasii]
MSQDNLFNPVNFQSSSSFNTNQMFHSDMQLQFASTVPPPPNSSTARRSHSINFSFQPHQDVLTPHPSFMNGFPGNNSSPFVRRDSNVGNPSPSSASAMNNNKQLQSKAERRAEHNAIERARRESLNAKFQQLAFILPNLQNDTRPSKSTIIDRTLDFVKSAISKEDRYQRRIRELEKFNSYLLSEADKRLQSKKSTIIKKDKSFISGTSSVISSPQQPQSIMSIEEQVPFGKSEEDDGIVEDEEEEDDEEDMLTENSGPLISSIKPEMIKSGSSIVTPTTTLAGIPVVSQSSVSCIPKSQHYDGIIHSSPCWPTTDATTTITAVPFINHGQEGALLKENNHFFQQQQQQATFMFPKFQQHSHIEPEKEEQGFGLITTSSSNNNTTFFNQQSMFNPVFMDTTMMEQDHYHHQLMHRR